MKYFLTKTETTNSPQWGNYLLDSYY